MLVMATLPGCGGDGYTPPSTEALLSIENVAKWYQLYRSKNRGDQPSDAAEFLEFINGELSARGAAAVDNSLLTSPRDGQPYVIRYGEITGSDQETNVVAYEKEGSGGMILMVTELARSREVDEAELQSLLSGE